MQQYQKYQRSLQIKSKADHYINRKIDNYARVHAHNSLIWLEKYAKYLAEDELVKNTHFDCFFEYYPEKKEVVFQRVIHKSRDLIIKYLSENPNKKWELMRDGIDYATTNQVFGRVPQYWECYDFEWSRLQLNECAAKIAREEIDKTEFENQEKGLLDGMISVLESFCEKQRPVN